MSWLDERIQQAREREERSKSITNGAPDLYVSLWTEIVKIVEEAKRKRIPVFTNGTEIDRIVSFGAHDVYESRQPLRQIHLNLGKDKPSINVSGDISITFSVDLCPDNIVCLKEKDKQISTRDAAIRIMDQFLFPELYNPTT
jgi:hypothetical protein